MHLSPHPDLQEPSHVPWHEASQDPVQEPLQVPSQVYTHAPEHPLHSVDAKVEVGITCVNIIAPTTGNEALTADLKNSRLDCKSFIILVASYIPSTHRFLKLFLSLQN